MKLQGLFVKQASKLSLNIVDARLRDCETAGLHDIGLSRSLEVPRSQKLDAQAHQRRQNHQERDDFAADVLLLEAENAIDKGNHKAYAV